MSWFYDEFESLTRFVPQQDNVIIPGNFNARFGRWEETQKDTKQEMVLEMCSLIVVSYKNHRSNRSEWKR